MAEIRAGEKSLVGVYVGKEQIAGMGAQISDFTLSLTGSANAQNDYCDCAFSVDNYSKINVTVTATTHGFGLQGKTDATQWESITSFTAGFTGTREIDVSQYSNVRTTTQRGTDNQTGVINASFKLTN